MDKQTAIQALSEMESSDDEEIAHSQADKILCEVLRQLGHGDLADAFEGAKERVGFWYA